MSELALQLIAENKAKHARGEDARVLDLGNCGLTEVPEEVGDLVWLEELLLGRNWSTFDINVEKNSWKWEISQNIGNANKIAFLPPELSNLRILKKMVLNLNRFSLNLGNCGY